VLIKVFGVTIDTNEDIDKVALPVSSFL